MPVSTSSPVGAAAQAVAPKVGATVASRTSRGRQNMVRLSADSDAQPKQQNRESHRRGLAPLFGEHPTAAERLACHAVFSGPDSLPELGDLADEALRSDTQHTSGVQMGNLLLHLGWIARDVPGVVEALSQHINITTQLLLNDYGRHEEKGKQDPGPPFGC
ncbi:hypothetical protein [Streptomyces bugieae]|uniref:Uncharacterized protein n=1 Tax=Streptomyces bugieae TaxID=3098223 RepID=A0ABU7NX27_9ACTN|nr:hypothetical protein [Streptomyces sp. DSM 41528]